MRFGKLDIGRNRKPTTSGVEHSVDLSWYGVWHVKLVFWKAG